MRSHIFRNGNAMIPVLHPVLHDSWDRFRQRAFTAHGYVGRACKRLEERRKRTEETNKKEAKT